MLNVTERKKLKSCLKKNNVFYFIRESGNFYEYLWSAFMKAKQAQSQDLGLRRNRCWETDVCLRVRTLTDLLL